MLMAWHGDGLHASTDDRKKKMHLTALLLAALIGLGVSSVSSAPLVTESKVGEELANLPIIKK